MDYQAVGFKAGLEIHQQLKTHKLFCECPSEIPEYSDYTFERMLRPTQSELGDVDRAALEEAQRKRRFVYRASLASTCLVESDEEPPHTVNPEAVDVCLTMALLLGAQPVDEAQFMRKIVIDGSNTTGFQRTALVAMNGFLDDVRISTITLEEDAARKTNEDQNKVQYGLDRLGIPLIEITTAADITSPQQAREVAEQLGMLLQVTKQAKHGLGTIRQDLNISIEKGARVEVKGIQSLSMIAKVAEIEVLRQQGILELSQILQQRVKRTEYTAIPLVDVSNVFKHSDSHLLQVNQEEKGTIQGVRLPGYHGLLRQKETCLGKELAVYARLASGISGIIHSDEMPDYGFSGQEIQGLKDLLQLGSSDAFALALGDQAKVKVALEAVLRRAVMYINGVPEEVRRSLSDGTTEYMRPLAGAARMYPETDVPPTRISKEHLDVLKLPERPEKKRLRLAASYHLNDEQITQLLIHGYEDPFEGLAIRFPLLYQVIIRTFINTFPELEGAGVSLELIDEQKLIMVFEGLKDERFSKEAVPMLIRFLSEYPTKTLEDALQACGIQTVNGAEIHQIIHRVVSERKDFIRKEGARSLGPLMGVVMKELRGKADGKLISGYLEEEIHEVLSEKKEQG
ncbi:MAG TPA: Glu-tRNA(Gln) amidotransferase subunit GatE [Candidatus Thermoplasmatota archaeon]|nr:Glu-tRNA(Gln) amidotransferase subunit GatE [Candidatus Thermoplasmatota archaeon]